MADVKCLSIFSGSGFHDTGVELALEALGHRLQPVGYIERDAAAAATLLARMGTATLGRAPVWCDCISRVDAKPLRGFVDLLIASPPCQPYSSAGKRKGNEDHRSHGDGDGPLVHLARIFDECRPAVGWFENVPQWFTGGYFREFGEQLSRMGYTIEAPIFSSSARLGNVHKRERVFCMVHASGANGERNARAVSATEAGERGPWQQHGDQPFGPQHASEGVGDAQRLRAGAGEQGEQGEQGQRRDRPDDASEGMALANGGGLGADGIEREREGPGIRRDVERGVEGMANPKRNRRSQQPAPVPAHHGNGMADAQGEGPQGDEPEGDSRARGRARELGAGLCVPLTPPGRDDYAAWTRLAAQGLDPSLFPATEPGVSVVADAMAPSASDLLRIGGNGVDPLVVADAFLRAWTRLPRS